MLVFVLLFSLLLIWRENMYLPAATTVPVLHNEMFCFASSHDGRVMEIYMRSEKAHE